MKSFTQFLLEAVGGQAAGKLEIVRTPLEKARKYAEEELAKNKQPVLDEFLPNFDVNYAAAKQKAGFGTTQRKDMPVIDTADVKRLQMKLSKGKLDVRPPHAPSTDPSDPFPAGLSGEEAKRFLTRGHNDGDARDDVVKTSIQKITVRDLKPIQKQIYFDKSFKDIAKFGIKGTLDFLTTKSIFIASADQFIIDGHHRFLSSMLVDPTIKVRCLVINLPIEKLLPLSLAFGDAIGNKRNR